MSPRAVIGIGTGDLQKDVDRIVKKYQGMISAVVDSEQAMENIALYVLPQIVQKNFESQGRRGGGSWLPLKEATIKTKIRRMGASAGLQGGERMTGMRAFGGGYAVRSGGRISRVHRPTRGQLHVHEPVRGTDRLYNSMVNPSRTNKDTYIDIGPDYAVLGTRVEYAAKQARGYARKNIPARNFVRILPADRRHIVNYLDKYIFGHFTEGGFQRKRRPRGLV